ncbi:AAA family ATPase [Pseudomonas sp. ADAK2]|uniref:AAA family ATPase n=1 Tax=unclassified Pseudomonas TaxID=196821 RepID=UPI001463B0B5|nr:MULTISPECIES: AAA family ATPase [unclassified Pseudomonas]QJI41065.1 AAA family ATPase [Pseudomonas sp. ADAK7]QJI47370.1 AAA family ATPase [Pseudomonas sp. ADAK2]
MSPLAAALMNSRIEHSMSRFRAANCAGVSERTWRSYEQGQRSPRKSVVRNFYDRSGISMPPNIAQLLRIARTARVLSITSLKGGVGKSPITVDVAACLVERGSNVAVITHDCCFEDGVSNGAHPKAGSLVAGVDFFGYADVFFCLAEKESFAKRLRHIVDHGSSMDRSGLEFETGGTLGSMVERIGSSRMFKDIKADYEYVLLDLNLKVDLIRTNSDLVAIIIDSGCPQSVDSAQRLNMRLLKSKGGRRTPRCFGLVTRNDVGGRSRELEEFCEGLEIPPELAEGLEARRFASSTFRERILSDIKSLPLTRLMTHLTNAHEIVIDKYNNDQPFMEGFSYFDSVLDISPDSHAADEIRRLTTELVDLRL